MVLRDYIKLIFSAIVFSVMVMLFSCEKHPIVNCSECEQEEPLKAKLEIRLESGYNSTVKIYEGNLEDSIIYASVVAGISQISQYVPLNRKYTITATYYDRGNCYVVVNSVIPRVVYDKYSCEEACYYVYDKKVDLRLKYKEYGN
ncbi:MAG: hypothetical protein V1903_09560 [Bacteroidota bacterium]